MSGASPPPPPPHGQNPNSKSSGLPPGNYDIFIIPPHSAGSGFLYLPSLRPQANSFIAGSVCTLLAVYVWAALAPAVKEWTRSVSQSGGGVGILVLVIAVGFVGWTVGQHKMGRGSGGNGAAGAGSGAGAGPGTRAGAHSESNHFGAGPPPNPGPGYAGQGTQQPGGGGNGGGGQGGFGGNYGRQYTADT